MEKNILEEVNRMMFYMKYTPGKVISEQKTSKLLFEEDDKYFFDWTENRSKTWETASIKNIITYIKERDSDSEFANSPIYLAMLQWFLDNDDEETRKSLKNWVGSDPTYGIGISIEGTLDDVVNKSGLNTVDKTKALSQTKTQTKESNQDLQNKQKEAINLLNKVKTKLSSINNPASNQIKKQVDRLLLELNEFNNKNVFMSIETNQSIVDNMNHILMSFGSGDSYNVSYESSALGSVDLKEMLNNLNYINLRSESESPAKVELSNDQTSPYKSSIIAELTTQASKQLQNKTFLDGFFRGVNPTISDMILKAKNITIQTSDIEVLSKYKEEKNKSDETGFELIDKSYQWPPKNISKEQRDELSNTFFEDDDVTITEETKSQLQKQVSDAVAEYKRIMTESNNKAVPKGLYLSFYSSTSKVRTAYSSKGEYSETNNIPLSKDRIEAMKTYLNELIDNSDLSVFDKVTLLELSDPNVGPGWNKLDSVYMDGSPMQFNEAYKNAPLFVEANKRYKGKLTPRQFYGARDLTAVKNASKYLGKEVGAGALTTEYENLYSSFRHASCGFNLIIQAPKGVDTKKDMDFIVSVSGGLGVTIYWTKWNWDIDLKSGGSGKRKQAARVFFKRLGRAILPNKSFKPVRKINCPVF